MPVGRRYHEWRYNIKMDVGLVVCEGMDLTGSRWGPLARFCENIG